MSPLRNLALLFLAAQATSAHFLLHYPATVGFSDDDEGTAPCGGFTVDFGTDNLTDFHVDNDVIAVVRPLSPSPYRISIIGKKNNR